MVAFELDWVWGVLSAQGSVGGVHLSLFGPCNGHHDRLSDDYSLFYVHMICTASSRKLLCVIQ